MICLSELITRSDLIQLKSSNQKKKKLSTVHVLQNTAEFCGNFCSGKNENVAEEILQIKQS